MSDETVKVEVQDGTKVLELLRGEATPQVLWNPFSEKGLSIGAVQEYLAKSGATEEEIKNSYVLYSYENLFLRLVFSNRGRYAGGDAHGDQFSGELKIHPDLEAWGINKAKGYSNMSLSDHIKMNRHYFEDKDVAMKLVAELRNIKVKVDKDAEHADNRRGDVRILAAQRIIESNIPAEFKIKLPVFVGEHPRVFNVEVEINPHDFGCTLISPDLKEIIDLHSREIIDAELKAIRELYPQLRIYQK